MKEISVFVILDEQEKWFLERANMFQKIKWFYHKRRAEKYVKRILAKALNNQ